MKLVLVAVAVAVAACNALAQCTNPRVRQEWSALSAGDKAAFVAACAALAKRPLSNQYADPSVMSWHDFVVTHSENAFWSHGNAQFYPYHRAMVWQFEKAIISTGLWPASKGIPYWDWSAVSQVHYLRHYLSHTADTKWVEQNWWTSDVFSPSYFGSSSSSDPDTCVVDGAFAKGVYSVAPDVLKNRKISTGDLTCLRRNGGQYVLPDATSMQDALSASSYLQFTCQDPNTYYDLSNYHASGHGTIGSAGSDLADASVSPNDPIFWLHHGFVDKYWYRWQSQCPQFKFDYTGVLKRQDATGLTDSSPYANLDSWPFTVQQMMDVQGDTLCYTYGPSKGDLPASSPPACPAVKLLSAATATASSSSASATGTAKGVEDMWLRSMFVKLVKTPSLGSFNAGTSAAGSAGVDASAGGDIIIMGRDDATDQDAAAGTGTVSATGTVAATQTATIIATSSAAASQEAVTKVEQGYIETQLPDGSTLVSYTHFNHTVHIPATHQVFLVFSRSVAAIDKKTFKKKRFFSPLETVEYSQPANFTDLSNEPGRCWIKYPQKVPESYLAGMNMDVAMYNNVYNLQMMAIDKFNMDSGASSPSC
ncbi:hypothetical protein HDU81_010275 [Chytriomyces hyalinus]|nr:hypothetical protein HDU81_010275 [Chytriomyces hyalinus]